YGVVASQISNISTSISVNRCYWAGDHGVKLLGNGRSIPSFAATGGPVPSDEDNNLALWSLLYKDPYFELRMLGQQSTSPTPGVPGASTPSVRLLETLQNLDSTEDLGSFIQKAGLTNEFRLSLDDVSKYCEQENALSNMRGNSAEYSRALARSIVAT